MADNAEYDPPWKNILDQFFIEFLSFFFPKVHDGIDWDKGYDFYDKEFQKIVKDAKLGTRLVDKLVKVHTKDGRPLMVLVHVEIQGQKEKEFEERMYVYNYRIYDRYKCRVVSLAVLTDENKSWKPDCFVYEQWGFKLQMDFPVVKLLDYNDFNQLDKNHNPFAIVVMAHLKTLETKYDSQKRYDWKWYVILKLYDRGYAHQDVIDLFLFIDWIMHLPAELKKSFAQKIIAYEEEIKMAFISSVEEIGIEKGMEKGIEKGIEKGMLAEARVMVVEALITKFYSVPEKIKNHLFSIEDRDVLKKLLKKAILSENIEQFGKGLAEV